jgi:hypothetical protein
VRRGTDINKLRGLAKVSERTLDTAETAALKQRIAKWPPNRRAEEAWGVETALMELERNPAIEILFDGRPAAGRPSNGPDIVAFNRDTGRVIVVEAKGGKRAFSRRSLRSTADKTRVTQTSPDWLIRNPNRYLKPLDRGTPADRRAAARLREIVDDGDPYEVMIVNSRPRGKGGYGSGMDTAADEIRNQGQVADLKIIDVQHDLP